MASLWVANPTKQAFDFIILTHENRKKPKNNWKKQYIEPGRQVRLDNLGNRDIQMTVDHHRKYGARAVEEVTKVKGFVGLIYSDKAEIKLEGIEEAVAHNMEVLTEEGVILRKAAAVIADQNILNNAPEGTTLKASHVDVVEVLPKDKQMETPTINKQFKVEDPAGVQDRRGHQDPSKFDSVAFNGG